MEYKFDWVKSEHLSLDWLQGWFLTSSLTDIFAALTEIGFDADQFVYYYDMNTRFYRDTFSYAPALGDIRIMYNSITKEWHSAEDPFLWSDSKFVDHKISLHSKKNVKYKLENIMLPAFEPTDDESYNQHFYISVSGDGLRYLRENNLYVPFLRVLRLFDFHCTRLDIALDIYDEKNGIVDLIDRSFMFEKDVSDTMVTTHMSRCSNIRRYTNAYPDRRNSFALSFGDHGSFSGMFRLYDKLHEMLFGPSSRITKEYVKDLNYWYRFELEAHSDFAWSLFNYIVDECEFNLAPSFVLISDRLFKLRTANWSDSTTSRYEINEFYASFLSYIIQNIEFADKFEILKRDKREDGWRLYVLNMAKVFYAINYCLSREFVSDIESFVTSGYASFANDLDYKLKCSSFKDYYLLLGKDLFINDDTLKSKCDIFNLRDLSEVC